MSIPNPAPPVAPGQPAGAAPQWAYPSPPMPRPPLPVAHRKAARRAGALGNGLVGLGVSLLFAAVSVPGLAAMMQLSVSIAPLDDETTAEDVETLRMFVAVLWQQIGSPLGLALLIGGGVLGVVAVVLGIVLSQRILSRAGVRNPAGVTWSALGIARAASLVLGSIFEAPAACVSIVPFITAGAEVISGMTPEDLLEIEAAFGTASLIIVLVIVIGVLVSVAVQVVIGLLLWWGMASAFRGRAPQLGDTQQAGDAAVAAPTASATAPGGPAS